MKYTIVKIPENLPPGKYQTKVISATFEEIVVEYVGPYNEDNPCLLPLIKEPLQIDN